MENTNTQFAKEIGKWIRVTRLNQGLTREQLASNAAISEYTIKNLENKGTCSLDTFIAVMRSLRLLEDMASIMQKPVVSPMAMLKLGKPRQRVRSKKNG